MLQCFTMKIMFLQIIFILFVSFEITVEPLITNDLSREGTNVALNSLMKIPPTVLCKQITMRTRFDAYRSSNTLLVQSCMSQRLEHGNIRLKFCKHAQI